MRKLTPEERERLRQLEEESEGARAKAQRIFDDTAARRREREERAPQSFWSRLRCDRRTAGAAAGHEQ